MTDQAAWFTRAGALLLAAVAAVMLFGARPEHHAPGSAESVARNSCVANAIFAGHSASRAYGMAEGARVQQEREARCPPAPRETWEPAGLQRGLMAGAGAIALLVVSLILGSMARREALAEESLREMRRQRGHR
jgi:hypothetical protein